MSEADSDSMAASGGEELVLCKGSTCIVLRFFGFRASDVDQNEVVCKECHRDNPTQLTYSTT